MDTFIAIMQVVILVIVSGLAYLGYRNYDMTKNRMTEIEKRLGMVEARLDLLERRKGQR